MNLDVLDFKELIDIRNPPHSISETGYDVI
jgi:hypothetical protein